MLSLHTQHRTFFLNASILLVMVGINLAAWEYLRQPEPPAPVLTQVRGVSYSPFRDGQSPIKGLFPTPAQMDEDLRFLADKTQLVRTYTVTNGSELIPKMAQRYGLDAVPGAWLNGNHEQNAVEVGNLITVARESPNVQAVIVGNEALLRGDLTVEQLIQYIRLVKSRVSVQVSTAEPWHVWLKYPELAAECDFIAGHFLPYWEGCDVTDAVRQVVTSHDRLAAAYPGKHIFMSEVGWPSGGWRKESAVPTQVNQERFVREFIATARAHGYDYCLMEAFDQPWKLDEGSVGACWGLFDMDRHAKFQWDDASFARVSWTTQWALAAALGLLLAGAFFSSRSAIDIGAEGRLFFVLTLQGCASVGVMTFCLIFDRSLGWGTRLGWAVIWPMMVLLLIVVILNAFEMTELLWLKRWRRRFEPMDLPVGVPQPRVSIHIPVCREPASMVFKTLHSLANLDYENFEVLVISNNTPDERMWKPVEELCARLGKRFRFFHLENWPGYKAGALNFAIEQTAPDAEVLAVIDSDYVVDRRWLRSTVGHFLRENVAVVQCPQDHRSWRGRPFKETLNAEYTGFFHLGMVHRNERNAIIQHGTMTMIRKSVMRELGGWETRGICEDAELGLRVMKAGYETVYINKTLGRGVVPDSFSAYKKQRTRWAYGAMQVLKQHWRDLLPHSRSGLTRAQKFHYLAGWLPWIGDGLGLLFTLLSLVWTLGLVAWPNWVGMPIAVMVVPVIGVWVFNLIRMYWLYTARVPTTALQRSAALLAGMALWYTVARASLAGLFTNGLPFVRTPKSEGRVSLASCIYAVRDEAALFALLWVGIAALWLYYPPGRYQTYLWMFVLAMQSLPFAASLVCSMLGGLPSLDPARVRLGYRKAQLLKREADMALARTLA
ncbi:MAG: glycosyltransferase [Phycisphaera sp.]|nr:glycosyltransferase [Phycisphaera sp.]